MKTTRTSTLDQPLLPTTTTPASASSSAAAMGNKAASRRRLEAASKKNTQNQDEDAASEDALMSNIAGEEKTAPPRAGSGNRNSNRSGNPAASTATMDEQDSMSRMDPDFQLMDEETNEKGPGYWAQIKSGYAEAVNAIIRPPRAKYSLAELGPRRFTLGGFKYERTDFIQRNNRNMKIHCSWWQPIAAERVEEQLPCVVYMHGNSSCRGEAIEVLPLILELGCTLITFDFSGCGKSDGDFVSLGWYERDDCKCVVEFLRASGTVSTIGLWGRSMGAATALMHGHRDNCIAGMVLDSSFASLEQLVYALYVSAGDQLKYVPRFMVHVALKIVRSSVMKRCGFDILKLRPKDNVEGCFIPAVFICGAQDKFIHPQHSRDIYANYAGSKNLIEIQGDHNSNRPKYCLDAISIFFYQRLCVPAGLTTGELKNRRRAKMEDNEGSAASGASVQQQQQQQPASRQSNAFRTLGGGSGGSDEEDAAIQRAIMLSMGSGGNDVETRVEEGIDGQEPPPLRNADDLFVQTHMEGITLLVGMGFDPEMVLPVLKSTQGNVELATSMLCEMSSGGGGGGGSGGGGGGEQPKEGNESGSNGLVANLLSVPKNTVPNRSKNNVFGVEAADVELDEKQEDE